MHRLLLLVFAFAAAAVTPALASTRTFSTSYVQATAPRGAAGRDAGVALSAGSYVRLSASGYFSTRSIACAGHSIGPDGCGGHDSPTAFGTLVGAFADSNGRITGPWFAVGSYANVAIPASARRLLLKANGLSTHELGAYKVVADVVSSSTLPAMGSAPSSGSANSIPVGRRAGTAGSIAIGSTSGRTVALAQRSHGGGSGTVPVGSLSSRSDVQYMLRRFGFSDTPANVTAVYTGGIGNWVSTQLNPPAPSADTSVAADVEPLPVLTGNPQIDGNYGPNVEHRLTQWQVATQWQLREKVTLHWLEHFSVSNTSVNSAGDMEHYIQTVRADALGNFAKLVSDVGQEPAMLIWLTNANNGYNPNIPPNENFGREVMQLYTIGLFQLNSDGTEVMDPNNPGQPLSTYTEQDVKNAALALTGFQLRQQTQSGTYPAWVDSVSFASNQHAPSVNGGFNVMGQTVPDPGGAQCAWSYSGPSGPCILTNFVQYLANNPTTWAFESKEMLQRFVKENPSPGYVQRISTVWGQTVNDPQQIAKVVAAIIADPEFPTGKYTQVKEPAEFEVDAIRALGGAASNPVTATEAHPMGNAINDTASMSQELWYPPSVFSFYYPGDKEMMFNNASLLGHWNAAADLASEARTTACNNCSVFLDFTAYASSTQTHDLAGYLLDALVDGGTPELSALVRNFLNNNPKNVQGALWIILTSPEYEVN